MRKFIVIAGNNQALVKKALLKRGNWEDITEEKSDGDFDNVHFIWKPTNLPIRAYAKIDSNPYPPEYSQIVNHFENINGICTKTGLIRSLRAYYYNSEQAINHRYTLFETTPTTFLITAGDENQEYDNFVTRFKDIGRKHFNKEHIPEKHCQENLWLIKPANLNQGRGIEIFKDFKDIQNFFMAQTPNSYWVAQKYIEKPLLYYGRKFDIRVWVLVTAKMEIFFYTTPYMRTSSDVYVTNVFNNYIHLTNNCLQKHGENFGKFETGNTLPLTSLQAYFDEAFPDLGISVEKHLIPRMKDLIIDTILSVKKALNPKRRKTCFELFGYDFLIDEDFRTWLLEVNTNPYLGVPNDFIRNLLPEMMDDLLNIVVDPTYPPTNPEFQSKENAFELIYCEYHSTYHDGPLNVRSQFYENIYPIPSIAPPLKHVKMGHFLHERDFHSIRDLTSSNMSVKTQEREAPGQETPQREKEKYDSSPKKRNTNAKPTTVVAVNQGEDAQTPTAAPRKEKRLSVGHTTTTAPQDKVYTSNNVAMTAKKLENYLESYTLIDFETFTPLVLRLINSLTNWELQGDNEISTACKSILQVSESKMCGVLTEPTAISQMSNLLDSQNVPLKIQVTFIKGFLNVCKKISEKKRIISDKMLHALIKIILASCEASQIQNYDPQIFKLAIKCLGALSGKYNRKNYIPGETRDYDKAREFMITQGGILALMMVSKLSVDEEIKAMPNENCFCYLEISDWELQKTILEKLKDGRYYLPSKDLSSDEVEVGSLNNTSVANTKSHKVNSPGSSSSNAKFDKKPNDLPAHGNQGFVPNVPRYLLDRPDYTLDAMIEDVEDRLSLLREEKRAREQEEVEKKEQMLQEHMKEQQQRETLIFERKKMAEELFLKRLEEKKKHQEELARKLEEQNKAKKQLEEEYKKQKLQELAKKKEEYEKKSKLVEIKKKKVEEETKKMIEDEIEKKKAQRKALEESFWTRLRVKDKEKAQEKIQIYYDETKPKNDVTPTNAERNSSLEPVRSQEDNSEKPKFSRIHIHGSPHPHHVGHVGRSSTFTHFYKDESPSKIGSSPSNYQSVDSAKGARLRSVDEIRASKREKEDMILPFIDVHHSRGSIRSDKAIKNLKQSGLFTLNEAMPEEEANAVNEDDSAMTPPIRPFFKQPHTVRHEEGEKLKKIASSYENSRSNKNFIYLKDYVGDHLKDKEKEKAKEFLLKNKESSLGGIRQVSPQNFTEFAHTNVYKAYIGVKRKFKVQHAIIKY